MSAGCTIGLVVCWTRHWQCMLRMNKCCLLKLLLKFHRLFTNSSYCVHSFQSVDVDNCRLQLDTGGRLLPHHVKDCGAQVGRLSDESWCSGLPGSQTEDSHIHPC